MTFHRWFGILGAVREAGGAFGKKEKAQEDQFFRQQQQEQLKKLKNAHNDEIKAHESEIKRHQEAIQRHKEKIGELSKWRSFVVYRPWKA